jgi:hypothetical protein
MVMSSIIRWRSGQGADDAIDELPDRTQNL